MKSSAIFLLCSDFSGRSRVSSRNFGCDRVPVNQLLRLATAKIFCSPPGCMLVESPEDIDSDAGIERIVGTEDDIDGPAHGGLMTKKDKN